MKNNVKLNISDDYKNSLNSTYATIDDLNNIGSTVSGLSVVFQPLGDYITSLSSLNSVFQPKVII